MIFCLYFNPVDIHLEQLLLIEKTWEAHIVFGELSF